MAAAHAAEQKPLIGATRDQVLVRFGEPKSAIVAGTREVLFFARERIVLRDGVVVEVEQLPAEQPRRPASQPAPPEPAPAPAAGTAPGATARDQASAAAPVPGELSPSSVAPAPVVAPAASASADSAAPRIEIKSVKRPAGPYVRPPLGSESAQPQGVVNAVTLPPAATVPAKAAPVAEAVVVPTPPAVSPAPVAPGSVLSTQTRTVRREPLPEPVTPPTAAETAAAETSRKTKARAARRQLDDASVPAEEPLFSRRTYIFAFIVLGGGLGLLLWQSRQRRLALDATAVSRTPFNAPAGSSNALRFNAELLSKLEWKRFEELVTSYYSKTGVVAARTKAGPTKPVHIKISWKGEPRPFAYVQCIPNASRLIDAGPVVELVAALTADDIRRGYIVTTGKFGVNARDLAEEKHITLLPGEIFLEKLNALPDAARAELMTETTAGDFTTPSCPKCEAKMVRAGENPPTWKCSAHPDQTITVAS